MGMSRPLTALEERAFKLLVFLEETPATAAVVCSMFDWTRSQFDSALALARTNLCPQMGVTIPHPVPDDHYRYHITGDWLHGDGSPAIAAGTAFAMAIIETRLKAVLRDVRVALPSVNPRSVEGRKANFMNKHLSHVVAVLAEIGPDAPLRDDE